MEYLITIAAFIGVMCIGASIWIWAMLGSVYSEEDDE